MSGLRDVDYLPRRLWWVLAGLALVWGFNWTAMKVALTEISPWTFRTVCLGAGAGLLLAAMRAGGHPLRVPRSQWPRLALLAFLNITCWNLLVAFGVTMIPSGRAAILAYTMPAWSIPLSVWLTGERIDARKALGLALGLGGIVLLLREAFSQLGDAPLGAMLVLGAAVTWALGTVLQKRYPVDLPPGAYTAWLMLVGGLPIFAGTILFDDVTQLRHASPAALAGLAFNVVFAFAWAHWAWIKIATAVSVTVFSLSMLAIPAIGVLSGILVLGERPGVLEYVALALVLASLATVAIPARREPSG